MPSLIWRSVEELENDPEIRDALLREFPEDASVWSDPIDRRRFLQLMSASLALAGLNGCTWFPSEYAVPYVRQPEDIIPGQPLFYSTSFILNGFAKGVLAETHMARPTKIEGNPDHPASLGGSDVFMQASLLDLYHPNRGKTPQRRGEVKSWDEFYTHLVLERFPAWKSSRGRGLRILTGTITSPSFANAIAELLGDYPEARWVAYDPVNRDRTVKGTRLAFGKPLDPIYRFKSASIILSIGADFLARGPADLHSAREFADRRRLSGREPIEMNRLYSIETNYSVTGANADHRLSAKPSRVALLSHALAARLGIVGSPPPEALRSDETRWLDAVAKDLLSNPGKGVVVVGDEQPAELHALGHAMNQRIGAFGTTAEFIAPCESGPEGQLQSLVQLSNDIKNGKVDSLFILGADPVYTAPADLEFAELLKQVPHLYCHDVFPTQTSFRCDWYLPQTHYLESWGDARAFDGTVSLQQPAVAPLYQGRGPLELLSALKGAPGALGNELLRNHWLKNWRAYSEQGESFESFWERVLRDGFIRNSAHPPVRAALHGDPKAWIGSEPAGGKSLEISFEPDPRIWDGRFFLNPWLQELPKPLTQLTWDNAALVGYETAKRLQLANEDCVRLELEGRALEAAVFVLPGHAEDSVTVHLGYGNRESATEEHGGGFNAYRLRTTKMPVSARGLRLTKLSRKYPLASSQQHQNMAGRDLAIIGKYSDYRANPKSVVEVEKPLPNLYTPFPYQGEAWAMVIDLTTCIGCKSCTIACQAENNIPTVGKSQVRNKREMHWIRVDRYFHGNPENPGVVFQPVPCMHCEDAPCEYVCPVMATVHSSSGLNLMVYNRCIGTRDCSNNCPYKVRRFNFLQYSDMNHPVKKLVYNPDVTVRERGVMEKCTYCVQRIEAARIAAGRENRAIRPGEVVPACAQACPTRAISFGNKNDPNDEITRLKKNPINYNLLEEQGTRPRTSYHARIVNRNPKLEPVSS